VHLALRCVRAAMQSRSLGLQDSSYTRAEKALFHDAISDNHVVSLLQVGLATDVVPDFRLGYL
jgi:hypothetical protein